MARRAAHEGPRRAPVLAARVGLEAGLAQGGERRLVVAHDDRDVTLGRDHRLLGEQQVDLRAAGLHPRRAGGERRGRGDGLEPEQRPEAHACLDVLPAHLDRHVLDHVVGGRDEVTRSTFAAWITRWAGERRAIGSSASGSLAR